MCNIGIFINQISAIEYLKKKSTFITNILPITYYKYFNEQYIIIIYFLSYSVLNIEFDVYN